MHFANLLYETRGPLALITINRPDKLNAISLATVDDLHAAIAAAAADPGVRVLAITGAGEKAFAAGSDLAEVAHRDLNQALEPIVQGVAERLERCPKPTIAAINGICFGGGLEVALGCDLRVAGRRARFATPEGKLGIIPGGGATQRLPRLVGRAWALDMLLTGEPIDAERALHIGLVTRLVDDADLGAGRKDLRIRHRALHAQRGGSDFVSLEPGRDDCRVTTGKARRLTGSQSESLGADGRLRDRVADSLLRVSVPDADGGSRVNRFVGRIRGDA